MRNIVQPLLLFVLMIFALSACVKQPEMLFEDIEQRSLRAWIEKYKPELLANYQEDGGYYVEIIDEGCLDSLPVTGKDVWLWYDFTGRDLEGNVCESRNWLTAYQQGSYTAYTHYTPAYRFSGAESNSLLEGSYLATFNELNIGGEKFALRYGSHVRLYLPSSVIDGSAGVVGDGGYEGQFSLDGNVPMIFDMTLYGHVANPVAYEGNHVDSFAKFNGGLCREHVAIKEEDTATPSSRRRYTRADGEETTDADARVMEYYDGRWHQPVDTLAQLYVNYAYSPARQTFNFDVIGRDTMMYPNQSVYNSGTFYGTQSMSEIDRKVNEILVERFGEGVALDDILDADSLRVGKNANVWYITRFLDGYIIDSNIAEVRKLVFGESAEEAIGQAAVFKTSDPIEDNEWVLSWEYAIPTMRYGQWAAILTVSTYGYGMAGKVGTTDTQTSSNSTYDYLNYMNYMNYMNSYYGYGYGGMYNNGYYGYNPYYYGAGYMPSDTESETESVTTVNTEIPAYCPLLFQIYIDE